jgi:hypothetical protein
MKIAMRPRRKPISRLPIVGAKLHVEILTGSPDTVLHFRLIHPDKHRHTSIRALFVDADDTPLPDCGFPCPAELHRNIGL